MSASDSLTLTLARSSATVGLGVAVGLMASIPAWSLPALYSPTSKLAPENRLRVWSKLYDQGKKTMLTAIPICGSLLAYSAFAAKPPLSYLPATWIGRHRKAILGTAAVLFLSIGLFTGAMMEKLNWELKGVEEKLNKESASSPSSTAYSSQAAEGDKLIATKWVKLHSVRVLLGGAAFLLSVAELAFA